MGGGAVGRRRVAALEEHGRACLAFEAGRSLTAVDVVRDLAPLTVQRGVPEHLRSDNGPEIVARAVRRWLEGLGVRTLFIEPASPRENGYVESFRGKLRDELLDGEIFNTLTEASMLVELWLRE